MVFLFLLFPLFVNAHVIQDDVATTDRANFSFRSVCDKMVTHESPLIDVVSGTELDCMGKKVSVGEFCEKELAADPYYLRGYVNKEKKEVVCVSGKKVLFKYLCVKLSDKKLCEGNAKSACVFIQNKLARRLDMVHSSFTQNDKGIKQLNCFFESIPLYEKK
ncbi:hypothetical protein ACJVC5_03385 [Peredibacter sp. HCB2-198]|uniref:hypothetical protein n=1 Tax=Peredibacter sp. HCB2-198 TaxID=3383025 RepID=UPI0038B68703